ncbi:MULTISPECIES: hypothetical protein [unclassified Methylobacterium]|uniref:hypothetical protein n=1 Tax=unclassified Methylobacterium TaxID=2615210 RepID=UPI00226A9A25|nr:MULTISPECIES: hypothetical protein [unclassified Methylobacterium]
MDFFKLEEWRRQWEVVRTAPAALGPLVIFIVVVVAWVTWWFAGRLHEGDRRGFEGDRRGFAAEVTGLKQQLAVRDERLQLAAEKLETLKDAQEEVQHQIDKPMPQPQSEAALLARIASLEAAVVRLTAASKVVEQAIVGELRATEAPDTAKITAQVH